MKAAFIVMSILGCDDAGATCTPIAQVEQQWQTIAACDAASETQLSRYTNVSHPMVVAVCPTANSTATPPKTPQDSKPRAAPSRLPHSRLRTKNMNAASRRVPCVW
jgi:hypothetical protein